MKTEIIPEDRIELTKLTCEVCGAILEYKGEMILGLCAEHIATVFDEEQGEAKQS